MNKKIIHEQFLYTFLDFTRNDKKTFKLNSESEGK